VKKIIKIFCIKKKENIKPWSFAAIGPLRRATQLAQRLPAASCQSGSQLELGGKGKRKEWERE